MGLNYSQTPDQRSIILVGETGAGKSAFGNFLLKSNCFATGSKMLSTTQSVEQTSSHYTEDNLNIKLHVFDLPGLNDPRKINTTYLNNTYTALKDCSKFMSTLFGIVIDISDTDGLTSAVKEIQKFVGKVELPDFDLTDNALLVFSHADKLGATHEERGDSLSRTIKNCPLLSTLLTLVRFRFVIVDSTCYPSDEEYWRVKMREILPFTRPKIRVLLLGPCQSAKTELLRLLRSKNEELGGVQELPGCVEPDIKGVSLNTEGCNLIFEKSFDFSSLEDLNEPQTSNELNSLINSIAEIHTFTAFCIVIDMKKKLCSSFIRGIKIFAAALTEDQVDSFYNRCFFLFIHCNNEDASTECNRVFHELNEMREMKEKMDNRFAISNTHPDTPTELMYELLKQVVSYSCAMKRKCYGKEFMSSILSQGFELPPPNNDDSTSISRYWPPKHVLNAVALRVGGVLALGAGGVLALAMLSKRGGPETVVAGQVLGMGTGQVLGMAAGKALGITAGQVLGMGTSQVLGMGTGKAPAIRPELGLMVVTLIYGLVSKVKKIREERNRDREYEYDFSTGKLTYLDPKYFGLSDIIKWC